MYTLVMHRKHYIWPRAFLVIFLSGMTSIASADDDYIEARQLLDSGKILPLETILAKVRQRFPGKFLEVDLEKEDWKIIYEIEILDNNGMVNKIYIDATTGQFLSVEEDD